MDPNRLAIATANPRTNDDHEFSLSRQRAGVGITTGSGDLDVCGLAAGKYFFSSVVVGSSFETGAKFIDTSSVMVFNLAGPRQHAAHPIGCVSDHIYSGAL